MRGADLIMFDFSMEDMPILISCLSRRMAEGTMGTASMPPEGLMERLLQGAPTQEDLLLIRELLQAEKEERVTISDSDPLLMQGIGVLNGMSESLLERIERAIEGEI